MNKNVLIFLMLLFFLSGTNLYSQKIPQYYKNALRIDSLILNTPNGIMFLHEVTIYPNKGKTVKKYREYDKLVRNFKKVYPYALEISRTYRQIDDTLAMLDSEYARRKYMSMRENQIMKHYKPILVKFTLSQSVLLVKLLDRESGSTAYEIIKNLKGSVKAGFWQTFAVMFGNSLKKSYDSEHSDKTIEYLVRLYNSGRLS